ncbi:RtcB family protein [bacterium]|nr:RtcB family protein [bacterium]MBI9072925.1 RtcB family protein [Melioribacteraceae bacterium]
MLTYNGKYNYIKIMIDSIEEELVQKIYKMLNHPAFKGTYMVGMPDAHEGAGAFVGFTMKFNDDTPIIPNIVGVDIDCGMLAYNMGNIEIDFEAFDKNIRRSIPSGFNVRSKIHSSISPIGVLAYEIGEVSKKLNLDERRVFKSLGTLGGGNHFIEVGEAPNNDKWVVIHTGSRNFGLQVAKYHQNKAKELMKSTFQGDAYKDLEYLPRGMGAEEYFEDMKVAQEFASVNRLIILEEILRYMFFQEIKDKGIDTSWDYQRDKYIKTENMIQSNHNYIDFKNKIIRKGATPANEGQKVIIPFNMRDGIAICTGKGNSDWNFSAPHGAGRILSRNKAKTQLCLEQFKDDMKGVYTTCVHQTTLDESPRAYKDKDMILDAIKDTVDVDFILKPLYNFKGY